MKTKRERKMDENEKSKWKKKKKIIIMDVANENANEQRGIEYTYLTKTPYIAVKYGVSKR